MQKKGNSKKLFIMIGTLFILLSLLLAGCMKKEPTVIEDKQILEYGVDLANQTFTFHHDEEEIEADFRGIDPEVDTMELGETEHLIEIDGKEYLVTMLVEDTKMPVFNGIEEVLTFSGEEVDIEEELKKRITAEDPVDGKLEVSFEVTEGESKHTYDVQAKAIDKNENETVETFQVIVEIKVVTEETEEKTIAFKTVNKDDANLNKGSTKVSVEGENGTKEVTYEVTYINGEEESREKVKEEIIREPKDKIVLNGTKIETNSGSQSSSNTASTSNSNTSGNSSSNNKQDKPKEESKPEPKPEPKPNVQGPSGSTLTGSPAENVYTFSYSDNSLPGGGKITEVSVIKGMSGAAIAGTDKDGVGFNYSHPNNMFAGSKLPNLSHEAISKLKSVGDKFSDSVK